NNPQISYSIAEKMMDHTAYLEPIYHDTTDVNKFFEEYKKAIPELIIDDSERDKIKIRKLEGEKSELEKSKIEVDEMRKRLENLEKVNNHLRDLPELRNIFSEFIQTVIQKGRNFNNYSIPTLLTG